MNNTTTIVKFFQDYSSFALITINFLKQSEMVGMESQITIDEKIVIY